MKRCKACGELLPLEEFHRNVRMPDGRLNYCKSCRLPVALAGMRTDAYRAQRRARYRAPDGKVKANIRRWQAANADRRRIAGNAQAKVRRAIKAGKLTRPDTCAACKSVGSVEAAHEDYSRPLDVLWLCRSCHRTWDRWQSKTSHA